METWNKYVEVMCELLNATRTVSELLRCELIPALCDASKICDADEDLRCTINKDLWLPTELRIKGGMLQ